jgi:hypothetical protein
MRELDLRWANLKGTLLEGLRLGGEA